MVIVVLGGGFVGQLVQHAIPGARLLDARPVAPADHLETRVGPQYLWEPIPGCESESFPVETLVDGQKPTEDRILAYKRKIGKEDDGGDWGLQFQHQTTGYRSKLPKPRVEYNRQVKMVDLMGHCLGMGDWTTIEFDILINTIPMPYFLELLMAGPDINGPFKSDPIYMTEHVHEVFIEGMVLNYLSNPLHPVYRETHSGGLLYTESLSIQPFSGHQSFCLKPGKIHPHRESEQVMASLLAYGCVCFGRFATWRPDELAHQTWKDIVTWKESL